VRLPSRESLAFVRNPGLSTITLACIGITACIGADLIHEALGHGTASWLVGDPILALSSVALQNVEANRLVSAAGTLANLFAGYLSLYALRRLRTLTSWAYFLWVFGAFNLFNVGYLTASALTGGGDWAQVIGGLSPAWLWRTLLGLLGLAAYIVSFRWVASFINSFIRRGQIGDRDRARMVWPAYLAAGAVLTAASLFNPISPSLILVSGVGASFGLNCGLPFLAAGAADPQTPGTACIAFSARWCAAALILSAAFIGILGPGVHFFSR
jgi:hypothetical protein